MFDWIAFIAFLGGLAAGIFITLTIVRAWKAFLIWRKNKAMPLQKFYEVMNNAVNDGTITKEEHDRMTKRIGEMSKLALEYMGGNKGPIVVDINFSDGTKVVKTYRVRIK